MEPPIRDIPPSIADIIAAPASERTAAEASSLAAFYRSIVPELEPVRIRLDQLNSESGLQRGGTVQSQMRSSHSRLFSAGCLSAEQFCAHPK